MRTILLFLAVMGAPAEDLRKLTILHSNDLHARLLPDDKKQGGFAYLSTLVKQQRAGCKHCLYLNAGDLVQGTPVSTMFKGTPIYEVSNRLRFDVSTLGNHEFDYGWRQIPVFLKRAKFPVVSANVTDGNGQLIAPKPYVIRKVNGMRVAIVGAAMGNLVSGFLTDLTAGPWRAQPVAATVKRLTEELRGRADVVVLLAHIHQKEGTEVIQTVADVDVVVEGHDHAGRKAMERVEDRVAVGCGGYGRELCRLDLTVRMPEGRVVDAKWSRIPVDAATIQPDSGMARLVEKWERRVSAKMDIRIATAEREFTRDELVGLMERAFREELKADFAVMNRGGVRDKIAKGDVLVRHVWNIAPFDNMMMTARAKGRQLSKFVKDGEQLDPEKEYVITTSDYLVNNESARTGLGLAGIAFQPANQMMRDVFENWIKRQGVLR